MESIENNYNTTEQHLIDMFNKKRQGAFENYLIIFCIGCCILFFRGNKEFPKDLNGDLIPYDYNIGFDADCNSQSDDCLQRVIAPVEEYYGDKFTAEQKTAIRSTNLDIVNYLNLAESVGFCVIMQPNQVLPHRKRYKGKADIEDEFGIFNALEPIPNLS